MNSTAITTIDLNAISHNLNCIRQMMPKQKILAMVKSNGYGHGLIHIAQAIPTVDALGVATIAEALQLRGAGINRDIVVMRGFITADEIAVFANDDHLIACVHDLNQLLLLENNPLTHNKKLRIWLKVDTGMHRLGISKQDFQSIYDKLNNLPFIQKPFVVCSHLADADNADVAVTQYQIKNFETLTKNINNEKSLLNSAGILAHPTAHHDWIRPGLMLYGVSPFQLNDPRNALMKNFIPAMTLTSKLIAIKNINKGAKVGYSCTFTASRDMKIGIVGMGYGDSYPRSAKNDTPVLIRGQRCPIVGRVSMDMITVDISHVKEAAIDDTVTLWGRDLSVAEIAHHVDTVPHELLCHLTGRVQRVYK
ncbi:MAG: alanine racemase [Gammaproteobacteria bacterium]|nr:alanine racemase [Gammaproteobacteria bacterium]